MARTRLTLQSVSAIGGQAISFAPVDTINGMQAQNSGRVALLIKTGTAGGVTIAIPSVACIHGRLGNISAVVPADTTETFGPFQDPTIFGDGRDQLLADFSAAIGGTAINLVAAVQMI